MKKTILQLLIIISLIFSSCKSQKCIPIVEYRDSVKTEYVYDSVQIIKHDSDYVEKETRNDTVFVTKELYKTLYKDKIVNKTDTIYIRNKTTEQVITNELKWWQKTLLWIGGISFLILLLIIIIKILKAIYKR